MKQLIKSELIAELQADTDLGLAFNQSGIPLQVMTFREFLNWYADSGSYRLNFETYGPENGEPNCYCVVRRLSNGKYLDRQPFDTEAEAIDEYYKVMERRYNDDNGSGGIFYSNAEAIARLNDPKDEWQQLFHLENIED